MDIVEEYKQHRKRQIEKERKKKEPPRHSRKFVEDDDGYRETPDIPFDRLPKNLKGDLELLGEAHLLNEATKWADAAKDPAGDVRRRIVKDMERRGKPRSPYDEDPPDFLKNLEMLGRAAEGSEGGIPMWESLVDNPAMERRRRPKKKEEKFTPKNLLVKKKKKKGGKKEDDLHPVLEKAENLALSGLGGLVSGGGGLVSNIGGYGDALFRSKDPNFVTKLGRSISKYGDSLLPKDADFTDRLLYEVGKDTPGYVGAGRFLKGATSKDGKMLQEVLKSGFGSALGEEQEGFLDAGKAFVEGAALNLVGGGIMEEVMDAVRRARGPRGSR